MYKNISNRSQTFSTIIKNTTILVMFIAFATPMFAQENASIQIIEKNPTIGEVFKSVGQQTGLYFTYDENLDLTKRIEISKAKLSIPEIMSIILKGTNRSYVIASGSIIIKQPKVEESVNHVSLPPVERINIASQKFEGVVTSMNGKALYDATIQTVGNRYNYITTTDNNGKFVYNKLPVGSYKVTVSHPDYGMTDYDLVLSKELSKEILFALQPKSKKTTTAINHPADRITKDVPMTTYLQGVDMGMIQKSPRWAIKTNLLADITTTISLGAEIRLAKNLTLDLPMSFNPWSFKKNMQWRHFIVQPELRWWGHEAFNRHFVGFNIAYGIYNVGGIELPFGQWKELKDHRYEGHLVGGGMSVGHQWILSKRLNLEANFGVGYFYTDYTKKQCETCGDFVAKGTKHYFGPTKAGISLIYIIK